MREFLEKPYQYSQFIGVWSTHTVRKRHIYCTACGAQNDAPAQTCTRCSGELLDVFRMQAPAGGTPTAG